MKKEWMKSRKIIFVTAGMSGGGTERVIAVLANYLSKTGCAVTILMTSGDEVAYGLEESVTVQAIGKRTGGSPIKRIKRILALRRYFKQEKNQAVVSFGTSTNLFSLLAHMGLSCRLIISERNDPNQCTYPHVRNMLYRMADALVFQTEMAMLCFPTAIAKKGSVIPNPLTGGMERSFFGTRNKDIVAVGRLEPQKNHKLLLRAFRHFSEDYPAYRLVLYGQGYMQEELRQLAESLEIAEKVVFAGFVSDVKGKIQNAAMYVLSSDYEGISNSLMEAMALGVPVISTDCPIGGSAMLIQNKESGLLVPVGDEQRLTEAMKFMAQDTERAEEMGKKAEYVKEAYSEKSICEKWFAEICRG